MPKKVLLSTSVLVLLLVARVSSASSNSAIAWSDNSISTIRLTTPNKTHVEQSVSRTFLQGCAGDTLKYDDVTFESGLGIMGGGFPVGCDKTYGFATYFVHRPCTLKCVELYLGAIDPGYTWSIYIWVWANQYISVYQPVYPGTPLLSCYSIPLPSPGQYINIDIPDVAVPDTFWIGVCYSYMSPNITWYLGMDTTTVDRHTFINYDGGTGDWYEVGTWNSDWARAYGIHAIVSKVGVKPPPPGYYYKSGYPDYCDFGIPDFDQKQDRWFRHWNPWNDTLCLHWTYDGPCALANCLWWIDSKWESIQNPNPVPPPTISDNFPLVSAFGPWDDHDTANVKPLIKHLAWLMDTDGMRSGDTIWKGTDPNFMEEAIDSLLWELELNKFFYEHTDSAPDFYWIEEQVEMSQDVILLLGFWQYYHYPPYGDWWRIGGHYVTVAGVNSDSLDIAVSDPYFDMAEGNPPGPPPHSSWVHNDADSISGPHGTNWHDRYRVAPGSPSPGGSWWIPDYSVDYMTALHFKWMNFKPWMEPYAIWEPIPGEPIYTEIEYAIVISPYDADFGDAPDPLYPSLLASNGARHFNVQGHFEWLGDVDSFHVWGGCTYPAQVDVCEEMDSWQIDRDCPIHNPPGPDDGVTFYPPYNNCQIESLDVLVTTSGMGAARYGPNKLLYLNIWLDWNKDGDWYDTLTCLTGPAHEHIIPLSATVIGPPGDPGPAEAVDGTGTYKMDPSTWPFNCRFYRFTFLSGCSATDSVWTRFRLSYIHNANTVTGPTEYGEVEDWITWQEMIVHDVGTTSIDAPPDSVNSGSTHAPKATVQNFGTATESFNVTCTFDSSGITVYSNTQSVSNLTPSSTTQVTFATWTAGTGGGINYTVKVKTLLLGDINPANDSLKKMVATTVTGIEEQLATVPPTIYKLLQNIPNPFTSATTIFYQLPVESLVSLNVYDFTGRLVRTLVDTRKEAGYYKVSWDGRDENGEEVCSGIYFYKLITVDFTCTRKMMLIR